MRLVFIFTAFLVAISSFYAGLEQYLEPAKIKEEIKRELAELDIGFNINLFNEDITNGIGIASQYRYEVEPSSVVR